MIRFTSDTLGTIFGIIGAILIALNIGYNVLGFILFLLSNIFYIHYSIKHNNKNILYLNLVFSIINIIAIFRYM